ncbi:spore germination protein [Paenibacillus sp. 102]|uniref:spore germination protein n=1 Tax=Paenibacillus sp. 102 TaxID=3120823 RepID=UPI0031BBAF02
MITKPKDRIRTSQAVVVVVNFILGTGVLTLPRAAAEKVKTPDGWISVILGGIVAMIAGVIIVKLGQHFPQKTFYQYNQEIVGKWIGRLLSLLVVCYFLTTSGFQIRSMTEVTGFYLLEGTPMWAIIMPFMWIGLYLIMGGINSIVRLFEIILPITILVFLLITLMSLGIFEIDNLRPVLGGGVMPVLNGVKTTILAYTGPEVMLILLMFMEQPNKAVKVILVGISIPLIFYVITIVMVMGVFSVDGVVVRTWPTIDLMRSFEIPGLIFERFESLLLVIWIMQIFATFTISYYAAAMGLAQLFNRSIYPFMFSLLPIIYIIAMTSKNTNDLFKFGDMLGNTALFLFGLLPLLLFVVMRLKSKKHKIKP